MIQVILLIAGIVYWLRRPKLNRLTASQFPGVPPDVFMQWRALELKSIDMFLWATWGLLVIGWPVMLALNAIFPKLQRPNGPVDGMGLIIVYGLVFLCLLTLSAIPGSRAQKLKKQYGIDPPK